MLPVKQWASSLTRSTDCYRNLSIPAKLYWYLEEEQLRPSVCNRSPCRLTLLIKLNLLHLARHIQGSARLHVLSKIQQLIEIWLQVFAIYEADVEPLSDPPTLGL